MFYRERHIFNGDKVETKDVIWLRRDSELICYEYHKSLRAHPRTDSINNIGNNITLVSEE